MDTSKTSFTTKVQQYADTQDLFIEIPHYNLQNLERRRIFYSYFNSDHIKKIKVKDSGSDEEERGIWTNYDNYINPIYEATEADWKDFW